jgi:hypothetical protein
MADHESKCNKPLPGDRSGHTTTACTIGYAKPTAVLAEESQLKDIPS